MTARVFAWRKLRLPTTRRTRARLAKLDGTRAGMVAVAELLREMSVRQDAHAHKIQQTARASRGALTEAGPRGSIRRVMLTQATDAVLRAKQTAEALDRAVEALERLAAALRDR